MRRHNIGNIEPEPPIEFSIGFAVYTYDQSYIEDNARENGIALDDAQWKILNDDILKLERNACNLLDKNGIHTRPEAHGDNDLYGTAWVISGTPGMEIVFEFLDSQGDSLNDLTDVEHRLTGLPGTESVWKDVSDLGQSLLDGGIRFFSTDEVKEYLVANGRL